MTQALTKLICPLALASPLLGQAFTTSVVARGLDMPRGILRTPTGEIWITEVPILGQPGSMGGTNRMSTLDAATG